MQHGDNLDQRLERIHSDPPVWHVIACVRELYYPGT
jgi:hypothetical protein